jgi:hypothetical protein
MLLCLQISQGGETIPIANEIPESACQVVVTNITAKEEFVICYNTSRINITIINTVNIIFCYNRYMLIFCEYEAEGNRDDIYRWRRFLRVPSSRGIRPVNRFSWRYRYRSSCRFASSTGISPLKLLKLKYLWNPIKFRELRSNIYMSMLDHSIRDSLASSISPAF